LYILHFTVTVGSPIKSIAMYQNQRKFLETYPSWFMSRSNKYNLKYI